MIYLITIFAILCLVLFLRRRSSKKSVSNSPLPNSESDSLFSGLLTDAPKDNWAGEGGEFSGGGSSGDWSDSDNSGGDSGSDSGGDSGGGDGGD